MIATYGFSATLTAAPGLGDRLVDLLLTGLDEGNPGASEHCVVYLVSRSASDPDVVHVVEGWTTEEDHHRTFAGEAARAIVAQVDGLLAGEPRYTDHVPVRGKAAFRPGDLPAPPRTR
ncbi:putative quinol monooxygenase [Saccharothrix yanglingensis]|uniref:Antibiotic biosynthesis monooxygenase n=1 Tax=Saccharothrix yanglingensis TaxID=659496 RepID=A0ABU0X5P0_9PSEU|nr:antibiotic biosynthesis monooxygenase [Saccharothrix yanglingensis]MDQ2586922.1 antibiotic biosynthesis monooxygenase [Saccharothrix yanglingensis]